MVKFSTNNGFARVKVEDSGTELSEEAVLPLFELFERGRLLGDGVTRGAGLGLPYLVMVARSHGGFISFGRGKADNTVFNIDIPLSDGQSASNANKSQQRSG